PPARQCPLCTAPGYANRNRVAHPARRAVPPPIPAPPRPPPRTSHRCESAAREPPPPSARAAGRARRAGSRIRRTSRGEPTGTAARPGPAPPRAPPRHPPAGIPVAPRSRLPGRVRPAARAVRSRPDPRPYERDTARRVRPVRRRGPDRTARPQSRHATIAAATIAAARVIAATTVTAATVTAATTVIAATVPAVWPRFTPVGSFPAPAAGRHQPLQGFVEPHHVLLARGGELP